VLPKKKEKLFWPMPIIPALGKLRQEDLKLEDNLGYIARPCLQKKPTYYNNNLF
jgi:hypothetical protein